MTLLIYRIDRKAQRVEILRLLQAPSNGRRNAKIGLHAIYAATIGVSAFWWYLFPQLRKARYLGDGRGVSSPVDEGLCALHCPVAKILN